VTALPIRDSVDAELPFPASQPVQKLFQRADLAHPPVSIRDLRLDTARGAGAEKTLMAFNADHADLIGFIASSPAFRRAASAAPDRRSRAVLRRVGRPAAGKDAASRGESPADEPEFPWWRPQPAGRTRRYAYSTSSFDFVEVIIDEQRAEVFLRAIN
jgi:hypothetical protein